MSWRLFELFDPREVDGELILVRLQELKGPLLDM